MASTLGAINPLRYRGYVYDNESGLYYLQSRYYSPELCRFINADETSTLFITPTELTDKNLFAYCDNDPINRKDDGGQFWHLVIGAVVGAATQYFSDVVTNLADGQSFAESLKPRSSLVDYGSAAISGALAASSICLKGAVLANAVLGGVTYMANCIVENEDVNLIDLGVATGIGALAGRIGGSGANGKKLKGIFDTSKTILKTAVSPKKIAMYTAKVTAVKKTIITSTARTVLGGITSILLNSARKYCSGSAA